MRVAADQGVAELGRLDIVLSNAGIVRLSPEPDADFAARTWADILGTNLTGGYHTVSAPPGYRVYYLNVMAGPTRVWAVANDPDHEWTLSGPRP